MLMINDACSSSSASESSFYILECEYYMYLKFSKTLVSLFVLDNTSNNSFCLKNRDASAGRCSLDLSLYDRFGCFCRKTDSQGLARLKNMKHSMLFNVILFFWSADVPD